MKRLLTFAIATFLLIALAACGGKKTPEELLVGTWVASEPVSMDESGMTITFTDMSATYSKDKTASGKANMKMSGAVLPVALEMALTTKSTWVIEGDQLKETITDADIKMITEIPGMPDMSSMMAEQMKAEGKGSSTILALDKTTLSLKENETGLAIVMKRK